jgi:hypothetical protein
VQRHLGWPYSNRLAWRAIRFDDRLPLLPSTKRLACQLWPSAQRNSPPRLMGGLMPPMTSVSPRPIMIASWEKVLTPSDFGGSVFAGDMSSGMTVLNTARGLAEASR